MSGRKWAYFGVILGFAASITANIASTVLKQTDVSLWLRVPFAVFWPLATYVAIEVLVRTDWAQSWSHRAVRLVLAGPVGVVAAFVSYLHQHHLMVLAGEPGLAQGFGPLAVDGMLFGMTATLIVTRVKAAREESAPEYGVTQPLPPSWEESWEEDFSASVAPISLAPVESAPVSAPPSRQRSSWDARQVAELILSGAKTPEIVEKTGAGRASVDRFRRVARLIQEDPRITIDPKAEKVTSDNIRMIRDLVVAR